MENMKILDREGHEEHHPVFAHTPERLSNVSCNLKRVFELRKFLWYVYETRVNDPMLRVLLYRRVKDFGLNLALAITQDGSKKAQEYWEKYSPYVLENSICRTDLDIYIALLYMEAENLMFEKMINTIDAFGERNNSLLKQKREELHVLYPLEEGWIEGYVHWSECLPEIDFPYMTRQIYKYLMNGKDFEVPVFKDFSSDIGDDVNPYIRGVIYIRTDGTLLAYLNSTETLHIFYEVARVSPSDLTCLTSIMGGTKELNEVINDMVGYSLNPVRSNRFVKELRTDDLPLIGVYKGTTLSNGCVVNLLNELNK